MVPTYNLVKTTGTEWFFFTKCIVIFGESDINLFMFQVQFNWHYRNFKPWLLREWPKSDKLWNSL